MQRVGISNLDLKVSLGNGLVIFGSSDFGMNDERYTDDGETTGEEEMMALKAALLADELGRIVDGCRVRSACVGEIATTWA